MIIKHVPIAVAQYPDTYPGLLAFAKKVRGRITGNPSLPNLTPSADVFGADVDAFDAAQTKAANKDSAVVADRNVKALKVYQDIRSIVSCAQSVADAQPTEAEAVAVIVGAGLAVRQASTYQKPELAAKYTGFSGEVQLVARAVPGAGAYYWEQSADQQSWTLALETTGSKAKLTGLTPGRTIYFRFRALTGTGKTDPSQVVSLLVH